MNTQYAKHMITILGEKLFGEDNFTLGYHSDYRVFGDEIVRGAYIEVRESTPYRVYAKSYAALLDTLQSQYDNPSVADTPEDTPVADTPVTETEAFAVLQDDSIRKRQIAVVRSTSESFLLAAMQNDEWSVRSNAAANSTASERILILAMQDENDYVRASAVHNSKASERVHMLAIKDEDKFIRHAAVKNSTSERVHMLALQDKVNFVRLAAVKNSTYERVHMLALQDKDKFIRLAAVENSTSERVHMLALQDKDKDVRLAAKNNLSAANIPSPSPSVADTPVADTPVADTQANYHAMFNNDLYQDKTRAIADNISVDYRDTLQAYTGALLTNLVLAELSLNDPLLNLTSRHILSQWLHVCRNPVGAHKVASAYLAHYRLHELVAFKPLSLPTPVYTSQAQALQSVYTQATTRYNTFIANRLTYFVSWLLVCAQQSQHRRTFINTALNLSDVLGDSGEYYDAVVQYEDDLNNPHHPPTRPGGTTATSQNYVCTTIANSAHDTTLNAYHNVRAYSAWLIDLAQDDTNAYTVLGQWVAQVVKDYYTTDVYNTLNAYLQAHAYDTIDSVQRYELDSSVNKNVQGLWDDIRADLQVAAQYNHTFAICVATFAEYLALGVIDNMGRGDDTITAIYVDTLHELVRVFCIDTSNQISAQVANLYN